MSQLTDLSVSFISLVETPATGKGLILKAAKPGQVPQTFKLIKSDDERMVAYGIVYAPDQVDSHGDHADADTIRKAAYEFMREKRGDNIDTEHSFSNEVAYVAESWLVRKGDAFFPEEPEGSWAVGIQIGDPDIWRKLKNGEYTGLSLAGVARQVPSEPRTTWTEKGDQEPGLVKAFVQKYFPQLSKEKPMDPKDLELALEKAAKAGAEQALKEAGLVKSDPPTTRPAGGNAPAPANLESVVADAVAKGLEGLDGKIDDAVTKAVAKGATETPGGVTAQEESWV